MYSAWLRFRVRKLAPLRRDMDAASMVRAYPAYITFRGDRPPIFFLFYVFFLLLLNTRPLYLVHLYPGLCSKPSLRRGSEPVLLTYTLIQNRRLSLPKLTQTFAFFAQARGSIGSNASHIYYRNALLLCVLPTAGSEHKHIHYFQY